MLDSASKSIINDRDYNECIQCIESLKDAEYKNQAISNTSFFSPESFIPLERLNRNELYKKIWTELELYLKYFQCFSERHRILYNHVRNMLYSSIKNECLSSKSKSNKNSSDLQNAYSLNNSKTKDFINQM